MPKYQFCSVCLENVHNAHQAGQKELPVPELAVASQLVHDGTRMTVEHLCEAHVGVALELAINHWGFQIGDQAIAWPFSIN